MNSTENIREGPCVIDPFKVRLNQKLKIDVNFLFLLIFYQKKYERARNLHFLRRLQAGHWRGWYQKFTPSLSFTFIPTMFYSMASEMSIWLHHPLQYAPIRSLRYFFNFLASKVWLLAVMDRIEEDALKRHKRPRRQLNSHFLPKPLEQGDGPGHGEGAGGKKYHANGPLPLPLG